jgi:hypothetical protein
MKKTLCLSLALTLALFLGSNTAFAVKGANFKGTFEAPFIDVGTSQEVPGSEGKLNTNGQYKVEIETGAANALTDFKICINNFTNVPLFLQPVTADEDGELKAEGNIGVTTIIQAPSFQVWSGGIAETCDGTLVYESGLAIVSP